MEIGEFITATNDKMEAARHKGDLTEFVRLTRLLIEVLLDAIKRVEGGDQMPDNLTERVSALERRVDDLERALARSDRMFIAAKVIEGMLANPAMGAMVQNAPERSLENAIIMADKLLEKLGDI